MNATDARMRATALLAMLAVCFLSGGATCARRQPQLELPPPPPVLSQTPTLDEVAQAVNRTSVIRELSSNTVTVDLLSQPSIPKLSATMALRRPREFRLRATLPIVMGSGLDLGSNAQRFWLEVPEGMARTLYHADHQRYQQQLDRAILPVDPTWVIDSLGLVQVDPARVVAGPVMRPDGKLELRSTLSLPAGVFQRVCYVDAHAGHVTDQFLFAPSGARIAESHATNHRYYPEQQCSLPHRVDVALTPQAGPPMQLRIDVGSYAINQILSGDPNLFVMPQTASQQVDLTNLPPAGRPPISPSAHRAVGYRQNKLGPIPYRGLVELQPGPAASRASADSRSPVEPGSGAVGNAARGEPTE